MPPDILSLEVVDGVMRIQDKPQVVPHWTPGQVQGPGHEFGADGPLGPLEETRVKDQDRKNEHEAMVTGKRFTCHQSSVGFGNHTFRAVPGGHFFSPSVFAFCFDLESCEYQSQEEPEDCGNNDQVETSFFCFCD